MPRAPRGICLEGAHHCCRHLARANDVAERHAVEAMRLALLRLDPFATERGRAAFPVDDRQLAPIAVRRCGDNCVHRLLGCEAVLYEIKCEWSQARVGSMLRQCRSDAGAGERAAGTDRNRGSRDHGAEHTGSRATSEQREGHRPSPGRTAVTSTSIRSSGLARPFTMTALKAGLTPERRRRTIAFVGSRKARSVT